MRSPASSASRLVSAEPGSYPPCSNATLVGTYPCAPLDCSHTNRRAERRARLRAPAELGEHLTRIGGERHVPIVITWISTRSAGTRAPPRRCCHSHIPMISRVSHSWTPGGSPKKVWSWPWIRRVNSGSSTCPPARSYARASRTCCGVGRRCSMASTSVPPPSRGDGSARAEASASPAASASARPDPGRVLRPAARGAGYRHVPGRDVAARALHEREDTAVTAGEFPGQRAGVVGGVQRVRRHDGRVAGEADEAADGGAVAGDGDQYLQLVVGAVLPVVEALDPAGPAGRDLPAAVDRPAAERRPGTRVVAIRSSTGRSAAAARAIAPARSSSTRSR